jgi:hypothetical protein
MDLLTGPSALGGSTPNWIVMSSIIALCFTLAWLARR